MKKLALSVAMILLVGLSLLALPLPAGAHLTPDIFVSPPKKKYYAPCNVSNTITYEIKIFNEYIDTGVEIYALEFKLLWDSSLLNLTRIHIKPPFDDPTRYFIIKNETGTVTKALGPTPNNEEGWASQEWDSYWLSFTSLDNQTGITDKVVIVNLEFHIIKEPCYPDTYQSPLYIDGVKMSGPCSVPIENFGVEHGDYIIGSTPPDMEISPEEIVEGKVCKYYNLSITLSNMIGVYGFGFKVLFPGNRLEASYQCVKLLFPIPYEYQYIDVGEGYVQVDVRRPCEKPPLSCGDMVVVTICLHTIFAEMEQELPENEDFAIVFDWAYIKSKCDSCVYTYDYGIDGDELVVTESAYYWRPKAEDLNLDCHVDIVDLGAIAKVYGEDHVWSGLSVTGSEPEVDLYDVVAVAKLFCKVIPVEK